MKKAIQSSFILLAILTLVACSEEKKIKKEIEGSWTISQVVTITTINGGSPSTDTDNTETATTWNDDGTGTASSSGSGTSPFPSDFTWVNSDATMTITDIDDATSTIYTVVEHSKTQMILNTSWSETISGDVYNYDITITIDKN
ncbi:hypothetical protein JYT74_03925 [Crocinitomix catalasitica]|nr:hypothetical protein [Crocinitomix catalasitica]